MYLVVVQLHHDFTRGLIDLGAVLFGDMTPVEFLLDELEESGIFEAIKKWADRHLRFQKLTQAQIDRYGDHFDPSQVEQHTGATKRTVTELREHYEAVGYLLMIAIFRVHVLSRDSWRSTGVK